MRRTPAAVSTLAPSNALDMGSRKLSFYENMRSHKLKYKSMAKEKRKQARRDRASSGVVSPKDIGEELPPFFMPQRYKLLFKMVQDQHNSNFPARKPMPPALKREFAEKSKEYHAYKIAEMNLVKKEEEIHLRASFDALDSVLFLPDYLMDECLNETSQNDFDEMGEFRPA